MKIKDLNFQKYFFIDLVVIDSDREISEGGQRSNWIRSKEEKLRKFIAIFTTLEVAEGHKKIKKIKVDRSILIFHIWALIKDLYVISEDNEHHENYSWFWSPPI